MPKTKERWEKVAGGLVGSASKGDYTIMESVLDLELARLRRMTASEKVAVMTSLWHQAWALKAAGIRAQHPAWPAQRVEAAVREIFLHDQA